ncbi:MAG TPA: hypothetical protein VGZ25_13665, partial [Gemmataceae bacterium]|nr:hypothetical protein [Gemmataceae bacterium]
MAKVSTCPECNRRLPNPQAIRCTFCGVKLSFEKAKTDYEGFELVEDDSLSASPTSRPTSLRKKRKKKKAPAKQSGLPIKWLAIGGGAMAGILLIVCIVFLISKGKPGGGGWLDGSYVVIDDLPDPTPIRVDESASLPEPVDPKPTPRIAWAGKPDPATKTVDYANAKGAPTPEQSVLLAAMGGPFVIGVPIVNPSERVKNVKTSDPAKPWKVVSLFDAPYPVLDILTGKEIGTFPVNCRLNRSHRLSSDAQYLAGWEVGFDKQNKITGNAVVWKRDSAKPVLRWPVPGPVFWSEFIGPNRLALAHMGSAPGFVVLDVTKGAPTISVPLPAK